jgi:DNA-binding CsgD family transcriptional regulator
VTLLASGFERKVAMTDRAQLHLVDDDGTIVSPAIREATEAAFRWVSKDYPNFDTAKLADLAEALAVSMQGREIAIEFPERYAYAALKGKVRDWLRTGSAQEQSSGIRRDMERIGGVNGTFQRTVDRRILFDQLQIALSERDRAILFLLLNEKTAQEVAGELKTSYPAARKAIQRVKERIGAILGRAPADKDGDIDKRSSLNARGLALE